MGLGLFTILVAFAIGILFTLGLAYYQSRSHHRPLFETDKQRRQRRTLLGWALLGLLGLLGVCMLGTAGVLWFADRQPETTEQANLAAAPPTSAAAEDTPAHLLIPALGLDSRIVNVSVVDGAWDISRLGAHVGWLETTGKTPADMQAMAFIGHVTISAVESGPFADLWTLKPLTEVIYRDDGVDYVYAIQSMDEIKPEDVSRLYVNRPGHLLLVTCTDWNYITETYDGRLLVDTVLIRQQPASQ